MSASPAYSFQKIKQLLDEKAAFYNQPSFIEQDPISIPHRFSLKQDQEIAGFIAASLAWGNRKAILKAAHRFMELMHFAPHDFILQHKERDLISFQNFVYRTFNGDDALGFISALQHLYEKFPDMESAVLKGFQKHGDMHGAIDYLRSILLQAPHLPRSEKHISSPAKGSAAKRLHMFFRWMVRQDDRGVDFGIWKKLSTKNLMIPLDVHTAKTSRVLGLLQRKANDRKAVEELTGQLRLFCPEDPVKYDFALFGMSAMEKG